MVPSRKAAMPTKPARALSSHPNQGRAGPGPGIRTAAVPSPASLRLHTADGARKYVTAGERDAFLGESERADHLVRTLCMTLAYAGCRLIEALALTADRIDLAAGVLVFETLKKHQARIIRAVPVPPALLDALDLVHGIRKLHARHGKGRGVRLWPWSRMTGWRAVTPSWQRPVSTGRRPRQRDCGTVSGWPPSPPAFH
jgi:integrase/recombinase XerD